MMSREGKIGKGRKRGTGKERQRTNGEERVEGGREPTKRDKRK